MKLIDLLRSLPMQTHDKIGCAISYTDIVQACKINGFNNTDILNSQLRKLSDDGIIEIFSMDDFDSNLIVAVKIK